MYSNPLFEYLNVAVFVSKLVLLYPNLTVSVWFKKVIHILKFSQIEFWYCIFNTQFRLILFIFFYFFYYLLWESLMDNHSQDQSVQSTFQMHQSTDALMYVANFLVKYPKLHGAQPVSFWSL